MINIVYKSINPKIELLNEFIKEQDYKKVNTYIYTEKNIKLDNDKIKIIKFKNYINLPKNIIIYEEERKKKNYYKKTYISDYIKFNKNTHIETINIQLKTDYWIYKVIEKLSENKYDFNKKAIFYCLTDSLPYDSSGYAIRSHNIIKNFNKISTTYNLLGITRYQYPNDKYLNYNNEFVDNINNVLYIRLPVFSNKIYGIGSDKYNNFAINYFQKLYHYLKPKKIHTTTPYSNSICPMLLSINRQIPLIYEFRGKLELSLIANNINDTEKYNKILNMDKLLINNSNIIISITNQLKSYLIDLYSISKPIYILPNCITIDDYIIEDTFNREEFRKKNNLTGYVIGFFGTLNYYEGIDILISCIEELNQNINILLIGFDKMNIKDELTKYNINNRIKYIEKLEHTLIKYYIKSIDLYIIPRRNEKVCEIISPIKPFEPMILKTPLLMSDCECLTEIADNGNNCYLFLKNNKQDLIYKINQIYNNGYDNKILENGFNYVKNYRQWINYVQLLEEIYNI